MARIYIDRPPWILKTGWKDAIAILLMCSVAVIAVGIFTGGLFFALKIVVGVEWAIVGTGYFVAVGWAYARIKADEFDTPSYGCVKRYGNASRTAAQTETRILAPAQDALQCQAAGQIRAAETPDRAGAAGSVHGGEPQE